LFGHSIFTFQEPDGQAVSIYAGQGRKLNEETRFVLERFGVPVPNEIESLTPTVGDLDMKKPVFIHYRANPCMPWQN